MYKTTISGANPDISFYPGNLAYACMHSHIKQHPYKSGRIIPKKALQEAISWCDAYIVLGINNWRFPKPSQERVRNLKKNIEDVLTFNQPFYELTH